MTPWDSEANLCTLTFQRAHSLLSLSHTNPSPVLLGLNQIDRADSAFVERVCKRTTYFVREAPTIDVARATYNVAGATLTPDQVHEPTEPGNQPIRARYLGHVTGNQPIIDQYSLQPGNRPVPPS